MPYFDLPLSHALRQFTAAAHERAERSTFVDDLLGGRLHARALADLLVESYPIYAALEAGLESHGSHPAVAGLDDPGLRRRAALAHDLAGHLDAATHAAVLAGTHPFADATRAYVASLADPLALVGHHYVRYLGDLSGGQVIARLAGRHYGVRPEVLTFYDFASLGPIKPYKDAYRARLDALVLTRAERGRVLDAAAEAFALNSALFAELGRRHCLTPVGA